MIYLNEIISNECASTTYFTKFTKLNSAIAPDLTTE